MISTDLYFFEKGISILDSDTMTSSKFTDWEKYTQDKPIKVDSEH